MRPLRQFTWGKGKSAGRNSAGRITIFHRGGGAKRLQREIDVKRSAPAAGIVERIEYDPNRSSRIALVRWIEGVPLRSKKKSKAINNVATPPKILEQPTAATTCGLFSFSSLPGKVDQRMSACLSPGLSGTAAHVAVGLPTRIPPWSKSQFFSALSSPKAEFKTAPLPLSLDSLFNFPRIAVAGAKPAYFAPRLREQVIEKNMISLSEVRKWRTHCALWETHYIPVINRQASLSWQNTSWRDAGGLDRVAEHNESKPKAVEGSLLSSQVLAYALCSGRPTNQNTSRSFLEPLLPVKTSRNGSLPAKQLGDGPKDETIKVNYDRAPFSYILASRQMEVGKMVINYDGSNPPANYERSFTHSQEGYSKPLGEIRIGTAVHDIECNPGQGAKLLRAAGTSAIIKQQIIEGGRLCCVLKMPSSPKFEVTKTFDARCRAVIGTASNPSHNARELRKAGQTRWFGRRPIVRGVAMNPVDHPHGGGEGRTKGGRHPVTPWGKPTKAGFKTVVAWRKRHNKIQIKKEDK